MSDRASVIRKPDCPETVTAVSGGVTPSRFGFAGGLVAVHGHVAVIDLEGHDAQGCLVELSAGAGVIAGGPPAPGGVPLLDLRLHQLVAHHVVPLLPRF